MANPEALSPERVLTQNERNNGAKYLINSLRDVLAVSPGYQRVAGVGHDFIGSDGDFYYSTSWHDRHMGFVSKNGPVEIHFYHREVLGRTEEYWHIIKGHEIVAIEQVEDDYSSNSHFRHITHKGLREKVGERDTVAAGGKIIELFASFKDA